VSRGLGKLQRNIKRFIVEQEKEFKEECDRLEGGNSPDRPECSFWLTWTDIRFCLYEDYVRRGGHYSDAAWLTLERAVKRALYTLWKRGEIGRKHDSRLGVIST
jgi:hypothetical protein